MAVYNENIFNNIISKRTYDIPNIDKFVNSRYVEKYMYGLYAYFKTPDVIMNLIINNYTNQKFHFKVIMECMAHSNSMLLSQDMFTKNINFNKDFFDILLKRQHISLSTNHNTNTVISQLKQGKYKLSDKEINCLLKTYSFEDVIRITNIFGQKLSDDYIRKLIKIDNINEYILKNLSSIESIENILTIDNVSNIMKYNFLKNNIHDNLIFNNLLFKYTFDTEHFHIYIDHLINTKKCINNSYFTKTPLNKSIVDKLINNEIMLDINNYNYEKKIPKFYKKSHIVNILLTKNYKNIIYKKIESDDIYYLCKCKIKNDIKYDILEEIFENTEFKFNSKCFKLLDNRLFELAENIIKKE
jgi:hypothetical protein